MCKAYLGIGGNIGDREKNIEEALKMLEQEDHIQISNVSSIYETEPIGYTEQEWFYNIVTEIETSLNPYELLKICNNIEHQLKRERLIHWGPRTIDIDILLYDNIRLKDEKLTIPHPRMTERAFVMVPLHEIAPDLIIGHEKVKDIMKNIKNQRIRKKAYD